MTFLELLSTSRVTLRMGLSSVVFTLHVTVGCNISVQVTGHS